MSAEKVRGFLMERGVEYHTAEHRLAYTTAETAEAGHVPGHEMAKPVLVMADGRLAMAVIPGDRQLDLGRTGEVLGAEEVRLASEDEFAPAFPDCEVGAEPPFGSLYGVPMVVDDGFDEADITFNAGTHTDTMTMAFDDFLEVTTPKRGSLTV
jgi:Ala-tRNA(Pro) deacylase